MTYFVVLLDKGKTDIDPEHMANIRDLIARGQWTTQESIADAEEEIQECQAEWRRHGVYTSRAEYKIIEF